MKEVIDLRKKEETGSGKISGQIYPHQQEASKPMAMVVAVVCFLIGLIYIFFQNNILTAAFFFLISLVILILAFKEQGVVTWEVTRHGVTIGSSFLPYRDLRSFWIEYQPESVKEISLQSKKWYQGYLKIPLNQENPLKIREVLLKFLPEERHEDTLIETISRKLGM